MANEALEDLGQLIDRLENLAGATTIPMPAEIHLSSLKTALPELQAEAKRIYLALGGENVWD